MTNKSDVISFLNENIQKKFTVEDIVYENNFDRVSTDICLQELREIRPEGFKFEFTSDFGYFYWVLNYVIV